MLAGALARLVSATKPFSGLNCSKKYANAARWNRSSNSSSDPAGDSATIARRKPEGDGRHRKRRQGDIETERAIPEVEWVRLRFATRHGIQFRHDRGVQVFRRSHFL